MPTREWCDRMDRERAEQRLKRERDDAHYEQQRATDRARAAAESANRARCEAEARVYEAQRSAARDVEEAQGEIEAIRENCATLREALRDLITALPCCEKCGKPATTESMVDDDMPKRCDVCSTGPSLALDYADELRAALAALAALEDGNG